MFFNFLKFIFEISISKQSKNIKKLILNKKTLNFSKPLLILAALRNNGLISSFINDCLKITHVSEF
jgi:hypothetical protein